MRGAVLAGGLAALAFAPGVARATPLSELAASLEPGQWAQLETTGLFDAITEPNGGATWSIFPFAEEGVWDPTTGQFFFVGGDHIYDSNDSAPRMIAFGDASNAWSIVGGIPFWTSGTMHGYDHSAMLGGRLYHMSLVVDMPVYRYDTAQQVWEGVAELPFTGYNRFGGLEPFPEIGGLVYVEGGSVYVYEEAADSWSVVSEGNAMGDYHNFAEYSPAHGVVLFGGGNGSGALYTLDENLVVTPRDAAPFPLRVNQALVTVDPSPDGGDFLLFGGTGEFLVYDVAADQLLVQDISVPIFTDPQEPVALTIAGEIDSYGVVMFVKHSDVFGGGAETWIYRHAPGMGQPPGDGSGSDSGDSGDGTESGAPTTGPSGDGDSAGTAGSGGSSSQSGSDSAGGDGAGDGDNGTGGCSCRARPGPTAPVLLLLPLLLWRIRNRLG